MSEEPEEVIASAQILQATLKLAQKFYRLTDRQMNNMKNEYLEGVVRNFSDKSDQYRIQLISHSILTRITEDLGFTFSRDQNKIVNWVI